MGSGFTLMELSIVLLLIALLSGGVVLGRDLMRAAAIRATVGQLEQLNVAVYAFRVRYNGLPGDLHVDSAAELGFFSMTGAGAGFLVGWGDGNSLIEAVDSDQAWAKGETLVFWRHLSEAGLLNSSLGNDLSHDPSVNGTPITDVGQWLPSAKLGRGNYIAVYSHNKGTYFELNAITAIGGDGSYTADAPSVPGLEGYSIDVKIDDGAPCTGTVITRGSDLGGALNSPSTDACDGVMSAGHFYSQNGLYALRVQWP